MLEENAQLKVQMSDLSSKFIDNLRVMTVGETVSFKMQELLDQLHEQQRSLKNRNEYLGSFNVSLLKTIYFNSSYLFRISDSCNK